jgi:hypothetical protein
MEQISEQHQKQLTTLRDEIRGKETQMETLKEYESECNERSIVDRILNLVRCKNCNYPTINYRQIMKN